MNRLRDSNKYKYQNIWGKVCRLGILVGLDFTKYTRASELAGFASGREYTVLYSVTHLCKVTDIDTPHRQYCD